MKVLIVSDIHANWPALSAVVAAEPYERLLCLGDIVDYGPHPRPCLEYIRQHADWTIRGNHDNALGLGVDCGCRGDFRELSVSTRAWHRTLMVVNPGSVGLPRDSGGKANYAVYEQGAVTLKQVAYDVEATIADLRRGPLSTAVVERLAALLRA